MINIGLLAALLFFCCTASAQLKQICVTVDDLPVVDYGEDNSRVITEELIRHFDTYRIPAVGFVNEGKLFQNDKLKVEQVALLNHWLTHGYELGNHTYSHADFNDSSLDEFTKEITEGEVLTRLLSEESGLPWRYFRHPYLHVGQTKSKADSLSTYLKNTNYVEAPVTIDNADYLFAKAYSNANKAGDEALKDHIGQEYIKYMELKIKYFERLTQKLFERQIPQILLTHANLLNADNYDKLAKMLIKNGYVFVTLGEALKDPAYQTEITVFGQRGISWIERWALSHKTFDSAILKEDPKVPEFITETAK